MSGPRVVVGVTGGIAGFKTAALVSQLVQNQADVHVVMTATAQRFVGPATFAALSGKPVVTDLFDSRFPLGAHIQLADGADLLCIAPASADFLAKMAQGFADDLLSTLVLCFEQRVIVAPAMNDQMWSHPAVQRNVQRVRDDGAEVVEPQEGWLSCRKRGVGRMADSETILAAIHDGSIRPR